MMVSLDVAHALVLSNCSSLQNGKNPPFTPFDGYSVTMCDLSTCGQTAAAMSDEPPPDGFGAGASIAALFAHACAYSKLAKQ
mmetsp:Transcript_74/g.118  ORF Transcript_74/g.118 Transcript_74/m.118 type:complete len:82 (+) Transcript_74:483-728(+)